MAHPALQMAVRLVYPPRCTLCGVTVDDAFGLCGACWRDTPFITGLVCDLCGAPLPGDAGVDTEHCDDALSPRGRGRAGGRRCAMTRTGGVWCWRSSMAIGTMWPVPLANGSR